jgi:hypothetical protein
VITHVERWASSTGRKRSDVAKDLIEKAIAVRMKRQTAIVKRPRKPKD